MERRTPPRRREGRELTEAVERLRAGGVVLLNPTQTQAKARDKNNGRAPTQNHPLSTTQEQGIMDTQNGNGTTQRTTPSSSPISHLETLAGHILGRVEKNEPVAKVTTVRTLKEKVIDGGIMCGAVALGGAAAATFAKYVLGFGRTPKGVPSPTT